MTRDGGSDRARRIRAFLTTAGWGAATRARLGGDASFRHYERLLDGERRALLMDAPPPLEDVTSYVRLSAHLLGLGLSAPSVFAGEPAAGLLIIEDFGDGTYARVLAAGADEAALYALGVDVLIALHRHENATRLVLPAYDAERMANEALLLTDWYLPAIRGRDTPAAERDAYLAAWREVAPIAGLAPTTLMLRDYHIDNLMWLPDRSGVAACGLLDFQDAAIGPASYDLVSLLEDARRDVAPALASAMWRRYLAAFPAVDRAGFEASAAVAAAQRHCRVIGVFVRLWRRDGKPSYLAHIPRVWRMLTARLAHPALAPLAQWFDRSLPEADRRRPHVGDTP
ncbi:MAG: aminoglycoside phosphotransferase [Alphaproteobacteria bacterium]|nr:aminoglycoside phosphotransferase [Alphaproteobacteria bacterium]